MNKKETPMWSAWMGSAIGLMFLLFLILLIGVGIKWAITKLWW